MKRKFPAHCPAFVSADGTVFEGAPHEDGAHIVASNLSDESLVFGFAPSRCIPLTATALLIYVEAGGNEETLALALSHKRGRKPTRLYRDAERYVEDCDARDEGY